MYKKLYYLIFLIGLSKALLADDNIMVSKLSEVAIDEIQLDYSMMANLERDQVKEKENFKHDLDLILKAKFKLIAGDIKMSEFYLDQIDDRSTRLLEIKNRYHSLIQFIQGNFKSSLNYLNNKKMMNSGTYSNICLLRLINLMALDETKKMLDESVQCISETEKYSKNEQYWLEIMLKLKSKNISGLKKSLLTNVEQTLSNNEMSRVWLKTGLFINKEHDILRMISALSESNYQSQKIREIIALMYLRQGDKDNALAFIDDIDTANAENIKGNISLKNKQYELAFGHFKLALQKKADSENALERAIPLSWILNQFEDGLGMINQVSNKNIDKRKIAGIKTAYLIRMKKFIEAEEEINRLKMLFQNHPPFEITIMDSYVQMIQQNKNRKYDKRKTEDSSENACKAFDGFSCWVALSYLHWDNFGKMILRDEDIDSSKSITIDSFKSKKNVEQLIELPTIDQKDIEELDSEKVQLN